MTKCIPLFKSHYSIGASILTIDDPAKTIEGGPSSIIKIAKDNGLKEVFLVEDSVSGLIESFESFQKAEIKLILGYRVTCCDDLEVKDEESRKSNHKVIVFPRNEQGRLELIKIASRAAKDGFYYEPRLDLKYLNEVWSDNLLLAIPFYDSFIYQNTMTFSQIVPEFSEIKPVYFIEENDLPFDEIIKKAVENYIGENGETQFVKSIYYEKRADFKAWQTFKCIDKRTSLGVPNMEFCSSAEFSFESWKEKL